MDFHSTSPRQDEEVGQEEVLVAAVVHKGHVNRAEETLELKLVISY